MSLIYSAAPSPDPCWFTPAIKITRFKKDSDESWFSKEENMRNYKDADNFYGQHKLTIDTAQLMGLILLLIKLFH